MWQKRGMPYERRHRNRIAQLTVIAVLSLTTWAGIGFAMYEFGLLRSF